MWPMRSRTCKEIVHDRSEFEQALAELAALEHFGFEHDFACGRGKDQALADGDLAARAHQGAPLVFTGGLGKHDFNAAGWLLAFAANVRRA